MRDLRGNLLAAAVTVGVLVLLGAVAGLVWSSVAPATRYVATAAGPQLADPETQTLIAADGWFAVITGVLGILCGVAGYVLARRRPIPVLLGLAGGGLLAAWVALGVGGTAKRVLHDLPETSSLGLTAYGVLFAWPVLATGVFWLIEFIIGWPEEDRREEDPAVP